MDKGKFKKLNKYHVIFLTNCSLGGMYNFSISHNLSTVGHNLWLIPFIYFILATILLIPMLRLCSHYPSDTLYVINEKLVGKWLGKGVNVLILLYAIFQVASETQLHVRIVQSVTLPNYTILFTTITYFLVMVCIVNGGIKSIARFSMLAFFMTVWMGYYSQWAFGDAIFTHLFPRIEQGVSHWILAMHQGSHTMLGLSLILFYYPYITDQKKAYKHTIIGVLLYILLLLLICIASVVYFSTWQLENLLYPLLNLYQAVELSNVERIENLGITLYIFLSLAKASIFLWVAKKGLDAVLSKHKNKTRHLYILSVVSAFIVAGPIPNTFQRLAYDNWVVYAGYVLFLLPIFLLMLHKIKSRKGSST
ncbi:endospore germination permease [Evansella sp. AB-P1]|uniref:GerAB/ArcD/ProY family transporter n=1 Tax=Evansella sp. AB-P1 TaxID=3037653 RepID=UPI00241FF2E2|nr:endospore germination permease [Evansella sp. AB-P1]MDG5785926.1 endospore germination permease [Evansella sp. AB-P1]